MTNLQKIHTASCDSYQVEETYLVDSISVEHDLFQTHYENFTFMSRHWF